MNPQQIVEREAKLRLEILRFFREAQKRAWMDSQEQFKGYSRTEIASMIKSLRQAGDIANVFGNTSGSIYVVTDDGKQKLEKMERGEE